MRIMQEPEANVERRYCPVCGTLYRKGEAGSPCGHVDQQNNITLTEPENETVLVQRKIFNPYRTS